MSHSKLYTKKKQVFFFLDFEKRKEICVLELVCLPDTTRWECDLRLEVAAEEGQNFFIILFFNCILFSGYYQYINPFHNFLHTSPSGRLGPRDKDPTQIDFLLSTSLPLSYFFIISILTHFNTFNNQYTVKSINGILSVYLTWNYQKDLKIILKKNSVGRLQ